MRFIFLSIVLIFTATHSYGNEISSSPIPQIISNLKDSDETIRIQAAETAGELSVVGADLCVCPSIVTALIHALDDPKWRVKKNAILSLGKIGSVSAIPALLKCLKDENWIIRCKAVYSLGEIGSSEVTDAIINIMNDEDESVRQEAITALGKIQAAKAIPLLINILTHSADEYIPLASLSLIKIGTPSVIPLLQILDNKNPQVRQQVAYALGEIRDRRAISPLITALYEEDELPRRDISAALIKMGTTAVPLLLPYMDTKDIDLKGCLVWILGEIGDKQATQSLIKILVSEENQQILKKAIWTAGKIGDIEALPSLISLLKNDYRLEESVIIAISRISDEKTIRLFASALRGEEALLPFPWEEINEQGISLLITATQDKDVEIKRCAALALGKTHSKRAVETLIALLDDADWRTQRNAVIGLGEIGDIRAVPHLTNLLNPTTLWTVKGNAAMALGKIKSVESIPPLLQSLKDDDSFTCACAAEALGNLKTIEAIVPLIELLNDEDTTAGEAAVSGLINIGEPCISPLLESIDRTNKIRAFTIFGRLRAIQTVDMLIDNLLHKNQKISGKAAWALGEIGEQRAIDPLIERLKDKPPLSQVIEAVGKLKAEKAIPFLIGFLGQEVALLAEAAPLADGEVASITISAMVNIGTPCVPSLIEVLYYGNETARANATLILGQLKDNRAVPPLVAMLKDNEWFVRAAVVIALGEIADRIVLGPLVETAMGDKNEDVRVYASNALGKIDDDEVITFLLIALDDSNPDIQFNAALALGERGYLEGMQLLIEHLNDQNRVIRKIAINRLTKIGKPAIPALIKAMGNDDNTIRKVATDILITIGEDTIVPLLQALGGSTSGNEVAPLAGDQKIIRWYAAIALGSLLEKTPDPKLQEKIVLALIRNLNDDSWYGRGGATIAIGNISTNHDALIEALLKGLSDANGVVRTTTAEALGKIGNPRALKPLTILSNNDTESCVRAAAKTAVKRIQKQVEE
ncbi:MAG: HEAT repeat domain-containing protein [Candidatus Desantisbacteria bacterium]